MSVEDETWDRPICEFCAQTVKYGESRNHLKGTCKKEIAKQYGWEYFPSPNVPSTGHFLGEFWRSPNRNDEKVYWELPSVEKIKNV